ncbi:glycosyltransferase family 2 protein [Paenibacillus sp. YIM B09110]|uniref:glycosyltransferase family 2 protein n=1 Tax=Paenibacillus sp. YIM B09110 TaxID=3126102 RepID=UPI00301DF978
MPKVSVVLTSYNHEKYIGRSIESVLKQTYTDYELIIVDDCSTDNSLQIIESYDDERIVTIRNERNIRHEGFYNAIKRAKGKYLAVHHSDDVWEREKLEKQVAFLDENEKCAAVFTLVTIIDENEEPYKDTNHYYYKIFDQRNRTRFEWLNRFFYYGNCLCHPSALIRKEYYEECELFDYGYAQTPDFLKWIKVCLKYDIHILQEKLVKFRVFNNESNTSGFRPVVIIRGQFEYFNILKRFLTIQTPADFIEIFPQAREYYINNEMVIEYALAMVCLEQHTQDIHKLFGLNLLLELVNDKEKALKIKVLYNFTYMDLIKESGRHDIFKCISEDLKLNTYLYLNFSNGYTEEYKISEFIVSQTMFSDYSVLFDIKSFKEEKSIDKQVINLRFDPIEGQASRCKILHVETDGNYQGISYKNATSEHDGYDLFLTTDPIYELLGDFREATYIKIEFKLERIKQHEIFELFNAKGLQHLNEIAQKNSEITQKNTEIEQKNTEIEQKNTEIEQKNTEINRFLESRSWKITRLLRDCNRIIKRFK